MGKQSEYYTRYRFNDNSSYKAEIGKDGITKTDMRNLRRVIKGQAKLNSKANKIDTVSLEAIISGEEKHSVLMDDCVDVEFLIETADEYETLHKAIGMLLPQQQEIIQRIYFQNEHPIDIAVELGITKQAMNRRLLKIYARLEKYLRNIF